jgi:hypothetical protein
VTMGIYGSDPAAELQALKRIKARREAILSRLRW